MKIFIFPAKAGLTFLTEQQAKEQGFLRCRFINVPDPVIARWKAKPYTTPVQEEMCTYLEQLLE